LAGTLFISMKTIQGSVPAKEILIAIERIYLDLDRGKQKIIPEELEDITFLIFMEMDTGSN